MEGSSEGFVGCAKGERVEVREPSWKGNTVFIDGFDSSDH
jgi:hypothetical protein